MNCSDWQEQILDYADGELSSDNTPDLESHLQTCPDCRSVLDGLRQEEQAFSRLGQMPVPENTLVRVRTALLDETRTNSESEIMTLHDVAVFLKVPLDALNEIAEELPIFELAGHLRVRRQALLNWIEDRERDHRRRRLQRDLTEQVSAFSAGVA